MSADAYAFQQSGWEKELFVCQFGQKACLPEHFFGPKARDYFLIHFVCSGCGMLRCGDREYHIHAGQGFLILPGEETFYQADQDTPWHYAWVGYQGMHAEDVTRQAGLDACHRIFTAAQPQAVWEVLTTMRSEAHIMPLTQMAAVGNLLRFFNYIAPAHNPLVSISRNSQYCEKAQWYLEGNYDRDVSIEETAEFVGISRSRLYRIMMEEMNCSPKELLQQIRLQQAKRLLLTTSLSREAIALRVGMRSGTQLGKLFRLMEGISTLQYRKANTAER